MKKIVPLLCLCAIAGCAKAQDSLVRITTGKTSSILFPAAIRHVDRGLPEVLVQQVRGTGNLLLVKAATRALPETNLSVLTSDGKYYSFTVAYDSMPPRFIYSMGESEVQFRGEELDERSLRAYTTMILDNPRIARGMVDFKWSMHLRVNGIYSRDNVLFFQLQFFNSSPIDYDVEYLRLYVRDTKKAKRTAVQEREITPLKVVGQATKIRAGSATSLVIALPKFTIPEAQHLAIEVGEKNGGRNLELRVKNKHLVRAQVLPAWKDSE